MFSTVSGKHLTFFLMTLIIQLKNFISQVFKSPHSNKTW